MVGAQNVAVSTSTDSLTVGEVFDYSIKIAGNEQYNKVIFPDSTHFRNDNLEFMGQSRFKLSNYADSINYSLQFFANKDIHIAPLPVKVITGLDTATVFTPAKLLHFKSVLSAENDEDLAPIKPIFNFKSSWFKYLLILLIFAAIAYFLYRKFKNRPEPVEAKPKTIPKFINPLKELGNSLEYIKKSHSSTVNRDFKQFYSDLSDAIRLYYEQTYNIPAMESTTREVIRFVDAFAVNIDMADETRFILLEADMVKFANVKPSLDQSNQAMGRAEKFYELAKMYDLIRINRLKQKFDEEHAIETESPQNENGELE